MERILKNLSTFLKSKKAKIALISRIFLISTFVDDGTRMLAFEESLGNVRFVSSNTAGHSDSYVGYFMHFLNAILCIGGSIILLAGKRPKLGCAILAAATATQILMFGEWRWSFLSFLSRLLSASGILILLYCETLHQSGMIFAGLPSLGPEVTKKEWATLVGRICIVGLYLPMIQLNLQTVISLPFIIALILGYKTQLAAICFVAITFFHAFTAYPFWMYFYSFQYEDFKFLFFQSMSAIGGILQILVYGAGEISVDAILKKD